MEFVTSWADKQFLRGQEPARIPMIVLQSWQIARRTALCCRSRVIANSSSEPKQTIRAKHVFENDFTALLFGRTRPGPC